MKLKFSNLYNQESRNQESQNQGSQNQESQNRKKKISYSGNHEPVTLMEKRNSAKITFKEFANKQKNEIIQDINNLKNCSGENNPSKM